MFCKCTNKGENIWISIRNGTVAYAHLNEHVTPVEEIEW